MGSNVVVRLGISQIGFGNFNFRDLNAGSFNTPSGVPLHLVVVLAVLSFAGSRYATIHTRILNLCTHSV